MFTIYAWRQSKNENEKNTLKKIEMYLTQRIEICIGFWEQVSINKNGTVL